MLNHEPETCENRMPVQSADAAAADQLAPVLSQPAPKPKFPASLTLSLEDAAAITNSTYCTVVGILGSPNAGKTAAIVSLYLLLGTDKLTGYEFRDSHTLMALEQISRGARRWNKSGPPDQMTAHTEHPDERPAGFIHLQVERTHDGERFDLLFPDLPGEWSEDLIDSNRVDRLAFLKRADAIWIMVDGPELVNDKTRQHTKHRTAVLLQRVADFLAPDIPPVTLVVTRRDKGVLPDDTFARLIEETAAHAIAMTVMQVASFSDDDNVRPGVGLPELMDHLLTLKPKDPVLWPDAADRASERQMLRFRGTRS